MSGGSPVSSESEPSVRDDRQINLRNGVLDSQELFQSEKLIRIRHGDQVYRLHLTALNKLILTK
ncbi:MAG TPA: hemin uptake protein HemP [Bauldia sp.]|nr:hemin uptake protein HemP [Bauldia sp.]